MDIMKAKIESLEKEKESKQTGRSLVGVNPSLIKRKDTGYTGSKKPQQFATRANSNSFGSTPRGADKSNTLEVNKSSAIYGLDKV